ncbi:MAG: type 1 fimbrial protein [Acinetobacter sp.]|uniref:fimbrial protein n=1 Tax=Acinetobacter guillouiae TaxID=106649 RepID=UPI00125F2978|nr:type 1 fimbrial protein [Acinetobacter guillouiae]MBK5646992.1 type 1 fimbrial protein [Acinetobacter sp.]
MQKLSLVTLSTLVFTLACTNVFAVDGTITVNGAVTDGTCILQGDIGSTGAALKDMVLNLPTIPKSRFTPSNPSGGEYIHFGMRLTDATGMGQCDEATTQAFKGIHLSAISPTTDLDDTNKALLVNKASGTSTITNPVFIRFFTSDRQVINFSASWGDQAKSEVLKVGRHVAVIYYVMYDSKTGIVDAQNVNAKINYTLHYN